MKSIIKATDIAKALMDNQSLDWDEVAREWVYYLHVSEDGRLVSNYHDAAHSFDIIPGGGWKHAEVDDMYNRFEDINNRYFQELCLDLLEQAKEAGYATEDDSETFPAGDYIEYTDSDDE